MFSHFGWEIYWKKLAGNTGIGKQFAVIVEFKVHFL